MTCCAGSFYPLMRSRVVPRATILLTELPVLMLKRFALDSEHALAVFRPRRFMGLWRRLWVTRDTGVGAEGAWRRKRLSLLYTFDERFNNSRRDQPRISLRVNKQFPKSDYVRRRAFVQMQSVFGNAEMVIYCGVYDVHRVVFIRRIFVHGPQSSMSRQV